MDEGGKDQECSDLASNPFGTMRGSLKSDLKDQRRTDAVLISRPKEGMEPVSQIKAGCRY